MEAIKNPNIDFISHPFRDPFPIDVNDVVSAACDYNKGLEVNAALFRGIFTRKNDPSNDGTIVATRQMVRRLEDRNGLLIINSDAHHIYELGVDKQLMDLLGYHLEFDVQTVVKRQNNFASRYMLA